MVKNLTAMRDTQVRSLGWEYPLEKGKGMAAHSSILAWEIPWTRGAWRAIVHGGRKMSNTIEMTEPTLGDILSQSRAQHLMKSQ